MDINIGLKEAIILSILCILIVFVVLMIISIGINLIKIIFHRGCNNLNNLTKNQMEKSISNESGIKFEDIKNGEDMLIAAFVASIDAVGEDDNKTVKIKSIKRI